MKSRDSEDALPELHLERKHQEQHDTSLGANLREKVPVTAGSSSLYASIPLHPGAVMNANVPRRTLCRGDKHLFTTKPPSQPSPLGRLSAGRSLSSNLWYYTWGIDHGVIADKCWTENEYAAVREKKSQNTKKNYEKDFISLLSWAGEHPARNQLYLFQN